MADKNLLERLQELGFALFEPEKAQDVNATLADMVKSRDMRLWEGFPVVLANAAEKRLFDYNKTKQRLKNTSDKSCLDLLMLVSLALYKSVGLKFAWQGRLLKALSPAKKRQFQDFYQRLKKGMDLKFQGHTLSSERLKSTFNNYFGKTQSRLNELLFAKEEFSLEYALSQVFSAKQKELFLKKLKGEKLTKTEREYFSRTVKKKVLALANPQLHRMAQRLLH